MALKNERLCNSALCIPTFVQEQERRGSRRIRYFSNNYGNSTAYGYGASSGDEVDLKKSSIKASRNSDRNQTQVETEKDKKDMNDSTASTRDRRGSSIGGCPTANGGITLPNSNSSSPQPISTNLISFNTNNLIKTHSNNCNSNNNINHASGIATNNESNGTEAISNGMTEHQHAAQQKQQAMKNYVVHHTGYVFMG